MATFYGAIQALHGVDLDVAEGEIVTLIGANGAGKSTLLMTICGNPRARAGTIRLEGQDITHLPTHEIVLRGVAQVPEGRRIFPRMSVYENLQMGAIVADPAHFQKDLDRVFEMFPRLAERREQRGGTLSGGEQQMLAIGRALMSRPRLLLLDEPSLGLAPLIVRQIFEAIGRIAREERRDDLPGRAERLPCAPAGRPRLRAGQRPRAAERDGAGNCWPTPRSAPPTSKVATNEPISTCFMSDWLGDTLGTVLLFNFVLVGPASFAAGQGVAITWRSLRQLVLYTALLSLGLRFFDYALAGGELWSIGGFFLGWFVQFAIAAFAYRLTRARQMVRQYPWLYERKGLLGWEERH